METWKTLNLYPQYEASIDGKIRNKITKKINEGGYNRRYLRCKIGGVGYNIHRLIAETFIPNPDNKPQVNHKDGNKHNNSVDNLEWVTALENNYHARLNGLAKGPKKGENNNCSKLDDVTLEYIKSIHKPFDKEFGTRALAKKYNVNDCWLSSILNGNGKIKYRNVSWN